MIATVLRALDRSTSGLIWINAYCAATGCPVREVDIRVKDYDAELMPLLRRQEGVLCPVCQTPMQVHGAATLSEHERAAAMHARMSVNGQMYERDHSGIGAPLRVLIDERLPPTPEGWFS